MSPRLWFVIGSFVSMFAAHPVAGQLNPIIDVGSLAAKAPSAIPTPALRPVIRRATGDWVDRSIGNWTDDKLRSHLLGELGDPQHAGRVPLNQLRGRSLAELRTIHDNLHEGYPWDGVPEIGFVNITSRPSFGGFDNRGPCPGGVCPVPSAPRRLIFRRR